MLEGNFGTILVILTIGLLLLLPFINHFYQKRMNDYVDELLSDNPAEYNRQIKANAYRYLISRSVFGLLFASSIYNIWNVELKFAIYKIAYFLIGIGLISWGIWSYKTELRKLK